MGFISPMHIMLLGIFIQSCHTWIISPFHWKNGQLDEQKALRHHLICYVLHRCIPPNIPQQVLGDPTDGGGMGGEHGGELCPRVYELPRQKHERLDKQIHMPWVHVHPP